MSGPFAGPEHESYLTLMRELRLERVYWQPGDLRWHPHANPAAWPGQIMVISDAESAEAASMAGDRASVWLPLAHDWLDMLEKAGYDSVVIGHAKRAGGYHAFVPTTSRAHGGRAEVIVREGHFVTLTSDNLPSREEALARLWMAVTGRAERG